jgi:NTP pyrophosphatase (non-canonical NTP hydrolase)
MKYYKLENRVLSWAKSKGILEHAEPINQGLKTLEEVNELLVAIVNDDQEEVKDALGDILVTIIIGAELQGLNLTECLETALNVIEKRNGKMINGQFLKD